jgi:hypothetical protein
LLNDVTGICAYPVEDAFQHDYLLRATQALHP